MSLFISACSSANSNKNSQKAAKNPHKIDWDNIWKEFYEKKSDNEFDSLTNFYNQQMSLFSNNSNMSSIYENMGLSVSNAYHPYKTGSKATSLKKSYDASKGKELASIARETATQMTASRRNYNDYYCAKGVSKTLEKAGLSKGSMGNAHQCASALENNKNFKEIKVDRKDLKNLPEGCIIVYNRKEFGKSASDIYGHIAVTLGNGQEASDRIGNIKDRSNEYRVFVWN